MSIRVHYSREPSLTTLQYCIRRFQSRLFFLWNCLDMGFLVRAGGAVQRRRTLYPCWFGSLDHRARPRTRLRLIFFPLARFYAEFPLGPAGGRPNRDVAVATARTADSACCGTTAAWRTNHIKKITKRIKTKILARMKRIRRF